MPSNMDPVTLRVNELYDRATVQGEGPHVGRLCTFVRLYGCNLHCRWCDTSYTWDVTGRNGTEFPMAENMTVMEVGDIAAHVVGLKVPLIVVSGGEPMLQPAGVLALANTLDRYDVETHIETNGTIPPPPWVDAVAHWCVSPKLPSAEAGPRAIDVPSLTLWAQYPWSIFKVVVATPDEVHQAFDLFDSLGVPPARRWVMPEGKTPDLLGISLRAIADTAVGLNLNISPRLHVQVWGQERGR